MTGDFEFLSDRDCSELSVPMMMDMLDQIHQGARHDICLREFAEVVDHAMCVLAELQKEAIEVAEEIETEKHTYGPRYQLVEHKVC